MWLFDWLFQPRIPITPTADLPAHCISPLGERQRHLFRSAETCVRCGRYNPNYRRPEAIPTEGE